MAYVGYEMTDQVMRAIITYKIPSSYTKGNTVFLTLDHSRELEYFLAGKVAA